MQLLGHWGRDDPGSAGGGDQTHPNRAALASHLRGDGMRLVELVPPEAPAHRHDGELGEDDSATDGSGHLLAALNAKPNVAVVVADSDEGLEPGPLSGPGLLLDGHNLQHLVLQRGSQEVVDDLELFDGQGEEVDLLQALDLAILYQTSKLGDRDPLLVLLAAAASTATSMATTAASTITASAAPASSETSTIG